MFGHVVSVGGDCQPAHQIRRITGRHTAQVFDWLLIDACGVTELLVRDFEDWLAPDTLSLHAAPYPHVRESLYGARFLHDFPLDESYATRAGIVRAKYMALVQRWRMVLAAEDAILFVWHGADGPATIAPLADALRGARVGRPFRLLALRSDIEEADWGLPDVSNRFLPQPAEAEWTGDDTVWDALFGIGRG